MKNYLPQFAVQFNYSPGVDYHGDKYLFDAIGGLGEDFANVMNERKKIEQTDSYNDQVMQAARVRGDVSEEDYNKYLSASHSAKTGIAAGHAAAIAQDWQQKNQSSELALRGLQQQQLQKGLELFGQPIYGNEPAPVQVPSPNTPGGTDYYRPPPKQIGIYGQGGVPHALPQDESATGNEPLKVDPFMDPATGKPVAGMGLVRKTGQIGYFHPSGLEKDPTSGALGIRDTRGNFKPLTTQQITAMQIGGGGAEAPGSPTPATGGGTTSGPLDQARAAIASGAPRDQVIARLRKMGIDPTGL